MHFCSHMYDVSICVTIGRAPFLLTSFSFSSPRLNSVQQPALFLNRIKPERHGQVNQNPAKLPAKPITFCQNLEVRLPENCRLKKKKSEICRRTSVGAGPGGVRAPKDSQLGVF
jgi:hypothetical protein